MRTHTTRYAQDDLNKVALAHAHPFQKVTLEKLLALGWEVQKALTVNGTTVITATHPKGGFGGIWPNGKFERPVAGKKGISWDWKRMAELAEATVPTYTYPHSINKVA